VRLRRGPLAARAAINGHWEMRSQAPSVRVILLAGSIDEDMRWRARETAIASPDSKTFSNRTWVRDTR
jgi:hypothetical protein